MFINGSSSERYNKVQIPYLNFVMIWIKKWGNRYHILDSTKLDGTANTEGSLGLSELDCFLTEH